MKKVIILGGNNNCNIKWLKRMNLTYKKDYEVTTVYYDNWVDNTDIDFDIELKKLKELVNDFEDYIIIAKSAGVVLSLIGMSKGGINPNAAVFMGMPLKFTQAKGINLTHLLSSVQEQCKILVIQQKNDPLGKAIEVKNILPEKVNFVEINGCYHSYTKYDDIKDIIDNFISI